MLVIRLSGQGEIPESLEQFGDEWHEISGVQTGIRIVSLRPDLSTAGVGIDGDARDAEVIDIRIIQTLGNE